MHLSPEAHVDTRYVPSPFHAEPLTPSSSQTSLAHVDTSAHYLPSLQHTSHTSSVFTPTLHTLYRFTSPHLHTSPWLFIDTLDFILAAITTSRISHLASHCIRSVSMSQWLFQEGLFHFQIFRTCAFCQLPLLDGDSLHMTWRAPEQLLQQPVMRTQFCSVSSTVFTWADDRASYLWYFVASHVFTCVTSADDRSFYLWYLEASDVFCWWLSLLIVTAVSSEIRSSAIFILLSSEKRRVQSELCGCFIMGLRPLLAERFTLGYLCAWTLDWIWLGYFNGLDITWLGYYMARTWMTLTQHGLNIIQSNEISRHLTSVSHVPSLWYICLMLSSLDAFFSRCLLLLMPSSLDAFFPWCLLLLIPFFTQCVFAFARSS